MIKTLSPKLHSAPLISPIDFEPGGRHNCVVKAKLNTDGVIILWASHCANNIYFVMMKK